MRLLAILFAALSASAAPPEITAFFPAGLQHGTTSEVTVSGKLDPWPPQVWVSDPAVVFVPDKETKGKFTVTSEPGTPPVLVRLYNPDGVSAPKLFSISPHPVLLEKEPNSALAAPQKLDTASLPITIEGTLNPGGDVDLFALQLDAGATINARVLAYELGSPLDPLLHIRGPAGNRIAFNHDATGTTLDPAITFTAPATATYTLQVSAFAHPPQANIRFAGSATSVYRLAIDQKPPQPPPTPDEPENLTFPAAFTGTIDVPGQVDTFTFNAKKGIHHHFAVTATSLGYPTDPVLRILAADGKALNTADDIDAKTNRDISLDWKAPADGTFTAEITDRFTAGSPHHAYRFEATTPPPSLQVTTSEHAFAITPGKPLEIKLTLTRRHGHTEDVEVVAENLPPGLAAEPVTEFDKKGAATLTITSKADAPPHGGTLQLTANGTPVVRKVTPTNTDPGDLLAVSAAPLWLTVLKAQP